MSEILVKYDEPISDPRGALHFVHAMGRRREDNLWEGWLEFFPVDETLPAMLSGRETTQPNRADVEYWAQGLSKVYLEGALSRAEAKSAPTHIDRATREILRDI